MAWYKTGTLAVTNGQTSVTGTGTKFASNSRVGDGLRGPDGEWYEVINIASETVLGIYPPYQGATVSGDTTWTIAPLQGYVKESADRLRAITEQYRDITAELQEAKDSAAAAKVSETNSKTSETNSKTSETNANTSRTQAASSATAAAASNTAAGTARTGAETARTAAQAAETKAKQWATNPENSAVETGQYSALHWAAKAKASADAAAGVAGPRLTSIANAVTAVNDILIANTATTMTSLATGITGRQLLGSGSVDAAKSILGLDSAITLSGGTNLNTLTAIGIYAYTSGSALINSPYGPAQYVEVYGRKEYPVQIVRPIYGTGGVFWTRYSTVANPTTSASDWGTWQPIRSGNFGIGESVSPDTTDAELNAATAANGLQNGMSRIIVGGTAGGFYKGLPNQDTYAIITFRSSSGAFAHQIASGNQNNRLYFRRATSVDFEPIPKSGDNGWGAGAELTGLGSSGTDLNDVRVSGSYAQTSNAQATPALNYPINVAGTLLVQVAGTQITTQTYITYNDGRIFVRSRYSTAWSVWKEVLTTGSVVSIVNGGTGASTSTAARTNLGAIGIGDYGIGQTGSGIAITTFNQRLAAGFYRGSFETTSGIPNDASPGGYTCTVSSYIGNACMYFLVGVGTSWIGYYNGTNVIWSRVFTQSSIVGTASQTSGVPTGAIIERGSNANGEYTKYADGTMEAWVTKSDTSAISTAVGSGFRSTGYAWTYPVSFSSPPVVTATAAATSCTGATATAGSALGACTYAYTAPASQASSLLTVNLVAKGRWY